jgi:hypothetical protein
MAGKRNERGTLSPAKKKRDAKNAHGEHRFSTELKVISMNLFRFQQYESYTRRGLFTRLWRGVHR